MVACGWQQVPAVFVVHPDATIALQAANEVGVVSIDFEVVAVERLLFDGDADHGLPVIVIIQQFVACFKVGGVDPVGVFNVVVVGLACRWRRRGRVVAVLGGVGMAAVRDDSLLLAIFVFDNEVGGIRGGAVNGVQH